MSVENASNICATQLSLPTIFDVLAADDLDNLLRPLFNYMLNFVSKCKPSLNSIFKYHHQFYLTFKTAIEWYFLKTSDASLSEIFYGMQRYPADINDKLWRVKSIFFLIYMPIIKDKLAAFYEELKLMGNENISLKNSFGSVIQQQYLAWYPVILGLLRTTNIIFLLGYITNRTSYASLSLFIQRIKLIVSSSVQITTKTNPVYSHFRRWIWRIIQLIVFFLQFYDWWNTNGENSSLTSALFSTGFRKVKPPKSLNSEETVTTTHGLCPICEEQRKVPAVIASTGILGCYECLRKYVDENATCPVTGCPVKADDLMRLFIS